MAELHNLSASVENFGPIKRGKFELKPLTIFIGPNNSGKSYMALLVYSVCQALSGRLRWPLRLGIWESFEPFDRALTQWYRKTFPRTRINLKELPPVRMTDLPPELQQLFRDKLSKALRVLRGELEEALQDYFGCESVRDLVRRGGPRGTLSVRLNERDESSPFLSIRLDPNRRRPLVEWGLPDMNQIQLPVSELWRIPSEAWPPLARSTWREVLRQSGISRNAYYLPAARSGILQGWQTFASLAVQVLRRRYGLQRIEVPPFIGVAGDFLQVLWERLLRLPRRSSSPGMRPALEILEGQVFKGEISAETKPEGPPILYKSGSLRLPLQRVSSMIGELAPLDLWIKHLLSPGDLLIIDEPEAHLHPEGQRLIARVLVRLVKAGVRVLCTTHSSLILHQVSNHLLASETEPEARRKAGFKDSDLIGYPDVAVYLFKIMDDGTHIDVVPVERGFGISEEGFVQVADAIGDETFRLALPIGAQDSGSK